MAFPSETYCSLPRLGRVCVSAHGPREELCAALGHLEEKVWACVGRGGQILTLPLGPTLGYCENVHIALLWSSHRSEVAAPLFEHISRKGMGSLLPDLVTR